MVAGAGSAAAQQPNAPAGPPLSLTSSAFSDGGEIPMKYSSCNLPQGASSFPPAFQIANPPKAAVVFVLIMHDLEFNPQKGALDNTHWTAYNIPATATEIPEGLVVDAPVAGSGVQGKNTRGVNAYLGPCVARTHHYVFELFALDQKLDLPAGASRTDLLKAMDGHVVGKSAYVGVFPRP